MLYLHTMFYCQNMAVWQCGGNRIVCGGKDVPSLVVDTQGISDFRTPVRKLLVPRRPEREGHRRLNSFLAHIHTARLERVAPS